MEQGRGASYWRKRFEQDSYKLGDEKKKELVRALLIHTVQLEPNEADAFLNLDAETANIDEKSCYSIIERKVADSYGKQRAWGGTPNQKLLADFRNILKDFYTKEELDEFISYMAGGDEDLAVSWLVGATHPSFRRIRNAYLPAITTIISASPDVVRDITSEVFSGPGDAVSKIERLVLGK